MKHYTKENIIDLEKVKRLNIINSITGIKPGNLIGSMDNDKTTNLAIFMSNAFFIIKKSSFFIAFLVNALPNISVGYALAVGNLVQLISYF